MPDINEICKTAWDSTKKEHQPAYDDLVESYQSMLRARAERVWTVGLLSGDALCESFEKHVEGARQDDLAADPALQAIRDGAVPPEVKEELVEEVVEEQTEQYNHDAITEAVAKAHAEPEAPKKPVRKVAKKPAVKKVEPKVKAVRKAVKKVAAKKSTQKGAKKR